jgi:two-component system, LytTR family, sensor histidine kinase AlgZ
MSRIRFNRAQHLAFGLGWLLFVLLLAAMLNAPAGLPWKNALIFGVVLAGVAQISSSTAIFSCRTAPLSRTPLWRLLLTHLTAALLLTFFWVSIGGILAHEFEDWPGWAGIIVHYASRTRLFYAAGFFYYLLSVAFNYALMAQKASRDAQETALESIARAREAELAALKSQINPHFLYNSLNSISALTSIDPGRAREMCVALADFLRLTLGMGEKAVISLREELELLDKYCAIEKVRFGERLTVKEEIQEEAKACLLPPLLLQPLFENAVVHGIAQMPEGGWIRVRAMRDAGRVRLTVENSWDPEAGATRRNGVGLKNVQRRLEARYGKEAQLQADSEDQVFRVLMNFPAETENAK